MCSDCADISEDIVYSEKQRRVTGADIWSALPLDPQDSKEETN